MIDTGNSLANVALGLFVGTTGVHIHAAFPLFNWFIFMVTGFFLNGIFKAELPMGVTLLVCTAITVASVFAGDLLSKRRKKTAKKAVKPADRSTGSSPTQ